MTIDPYKSNMAAKVKFVKKRIVRARVVVVLEGTVENRGIQLIAPGSRCVRKGEIFEFMSSHENAKPGDTVNTVSYLGFAEVETAGVVRAGDLIQVNGKTIATVTGFDETHFPNHQNFVFKPLDSEKDFEHTFDLEEEIVFIQK